MYFVQHCFICHLSDYIVSTEGAGIEPRTVYTRVDRVHNGLDLVHIRRDRIHTRLDRIHTRLDLVHTRVERIHTHLDLAHNRLDLIHTRIDRIHNRVVRIHTRLDRIHTRLGLFHNTSTYVSCFHLKFDMFSLGNFCLCFRWRDKEPRWGQNGIKCYCREPCYLYQIHSCQDSASWWVIPDSGSYPNSAKCSDLDRGATSALDPYSLNPDPDPGILLNPVEDSSIAEYGYSQNPNPDLDLLWQNLYWKNIYNWKFFGSKAVIHIIYFFLNLQNTFRLFIHEISLFFLGGGAMSTCLWIRIPNPDLDPKHWAQRFRFWPKKEWILYFVHSLFRVIVAGKSYQSGFAKQFEIPSIFDIGLSSETLQKLTG